MSFVKTLLCASTFQNPNKKSVIALKPKSNIESIPATGKQTYQMTKNTHLTSL